MAYDAYLQIDGIKGDSADSVHKEWIEVESYSHGLAQAIGGSASAEGAHAGGRADHQDFAITKRLDSASPLLALYCCNGKHIPNIKMELCRAMGEKTTFMVYDFRDCIVASYSPSGTADSEDPIPMEEISFRYGEIRWSYTQTDPTGGGKKGAAIKAGWSTRENKPL